MASETELCNRALGQAGAQTTIQSIDDQRDKAAQTCRLYFGPTRDAMLRAAHWDFARKAAYLTVIKALPGTPENPSTGDGYWQPQYPAPPWVYSYQYPSDCIAVRYISPQLQTGWNSDQIPITPVQVGYPLYFGNLCIRPQKFMVAHDTDLQGQACRCVLSDQNLAIAIYTVRVTNPDLWDSSFEEGFVDALAARLVFPLSGDKTLRRDLIASAKRSILEAQARDGNEGLKFDDAVPDWIRIRGWSNIAYADWVGQCAYPGFLLS